MFGVHSQLTPPFTRNAYLYLKLYNHTCIYIQAQATLLFHTPSHTHSQMHTYMIIMCLHACLSKDLLNYKKK